MKNKTIFYTIIVADTWWTMCSLFVILHPLGWDTVQPLLVKIHPALIEGLGATSTILFAR